MKISALLVAVVSLLVAFSASVNADDQDYNNGIKQDLSQDVQQMYPKRPKADAAQVAAVDPQAQPVKTFQVQPAPAQATIPVVAQTLPPAATVSATQFQGAPQVQAQAQTQTQVQSGQLQPVYILQQPQTAPPAQVQPVTNVEDTPVKEPKIESLRKQREGMERQTEDKLMQKLEDDRVTSEKDRADRIFNTPVPSPSPAALSSTAATTTATTAVVAPPPQAVQVPPAAIADPPPTKASVAADPADSAPVTAVGDPDVVSATNIDTSQSSDQDTSSKFSIGALAGIGSYPTVGNISGSIAAGVSVGLELPSRLGLEADGVFSNYNIQNTTPCFGCGPGQSLVENLNQINIDAGLDYFILPGKITPVVGVLAGYTRRSYSSTINYGFSSGGTTGSNAFDGGLKAGVQVGLSSSLAISLDFRYLMNISYRTDNALTYFGPTFGAPVESLNYYFATLGLRLAF